MHRLVIRPQSVSMMPFPKACPENLTSSSGSTVGTKTHAIQSSVSLTVTGKIKTQEANNEL